MKINSKKMESLIIPGSLLTLVLVKLKDLKKTLVADLICKP